MARTVFIITIFVTGLSIVCPAMAQTATGDAAKVEAGAQVYDDNCFTCHGEKLVSPGQIFDLRQLKSSERARFDVAVRKGRGQMPPWEGVLSDEQIDQVWQYIRANSVEK